MNTYKQKAASLLILSLTLLLVSGEEPKFAPDLLSPEKQQAFEERARKGDKDAAFLLYRYHLMSLGNFEAAYIWGNHALNLGSASITKESLDELLLFIISPESKPKEELSRDKLLPDEN